MDVTNISKLAKLTISEKHLKKFSSEFESVLKLVSKLQNLKLDNIAGTTHSLKVKNVLREDEIQANRILSQADALSNAKNTYNGFFVVDAILKQNE